MVRMVTIQTPEPSEGRYAKSQGTKVFSDGKEVHNISSIAVHIGVDDNVTAQIELFGWLETVDGADARFVMRHPFTKEIVEITKLVFGDGTWLKL